MKIRRKLLILFYPLFLSIQKFLGKGNSLSSPQKIKPHENLYGIQLELINGKPYSLSELKGKKIMIVNTASDCGYTAQYAELQELYKREKNRLEIIAAPSNDFKNQEKDSNQEIETFCKVNFGVSFPILSKMSVIPSNEQHPLYSWLSDKNKNGWLDKAPSWNFSKYLINEEGYLTHYFEPAVSPLSREITAAINE